jgi:uncharacterized protein YkwD
MKLFRYLSALTVFTVAVGLCSQGAAHASTSLTVRRMTTVEHRWATAVFTLMNVERVAHDRAPLRLNRHLVHSAMYHNVWMARTNTLSHQLPNEPSFSDRELDFGYRWSTAGENCSVNPVVSLRGVLQLEQMMYHERPPGETGHRENILSRAYRDVGIAVLIDTKHDRVWMTEDFGAPA